MARIKIRDTIIGESPKIAVSITGSTKNSIIEIARGIDIKKIDLVEWRVDFLKDGFMVEETMTRDIKPNKSLDLDIGKILDILRILREIFKDTPLIFTFRSKKEGGERTISIDDYIGLNRSVARSKMVDLIDVEVFSIEGRAEELIGEIHDEGVLAIGSNHDFLGTPSQEEIAYRLKYMEDLGADILKIALMANSPEDVLNLLTISNQMKNISKKPLITISMGELGTISRISGGAFGSSITFASLDKSSAPGQVPVDLLFEILNISR